MFKLIFLRLFLAFQINFFNSDRMIAHAAKGHRSELIPGVAAARPEPSVMVCVLHLVSYHGALIFLIVFIFRFAFKSQTNLKLAGVTLRTLNPQLHSADLLVEQPQTHYLPVEVKNRLSSDGC